VVEKPTWTVLKRQSTHLMEGNPTANNISSINVQCNGYSYHLIHTQSSLILSVLYLSEIVISINVPCKPLWIKASATYPQMQRNYWIIQSFGSYIKSADILSPNQTLSVPKPVRFKARLCIDDVKWEMFVELLSLMQLIKPTSNILFSCTNYF